MAYTVIMSETFRRWMRALRNRQAQARLAVRLDRVADGNFGDHRSVGQRVSELRINVAQGYRVYYTIRDKTLVILLCGGDKASQQQDIHRAQQMEREL
ncbi:MAG: type II toxin-antitoxin system RelE/ParE family toxin [Desulfurellaceae bacterium]|nr:type II toxin-antitoxin system RelE/ParE family toxin [Desulfurellaceae bacterium]